MYFCILVYKKSHSANVNITMWKEIWCFTEFSKIIGLICQGFESGEMFAGVPLLAEPSRCPVSEFVGSCTALYLTGYGPMLEQCFKSCSLWEAHVGSD